MGGITWLHLSDWHQKKSDEFDRRVVRDALISDIKKLTNLSPDLDKIDFIVFSGDVAFSGLSAEYRAAIKEFFDPLLKATNLSVDQLFIVPGNHDLNRDDLIRYKIPPNVAGDFPHWLDDETTRKYFLKPFRSFKSFVEKYTHRIQADYTNILEFNINGIKVALMGINSAVTSARERDIGESTDKGFLQVSEPQIRKLLNSISDADVKIAVLHHPLNWLAESDINKVESILTNNFNFILSGHQHTPKVEIQFSNTSGNCIRISTGLGFSKRTADGPLYLNAYNFVHLDFDTGKGTVFPRRWSSAQMQWTADIDHFNSEIIEFSLPSGDVKRENKTKNIRRKLLDLASDEIIPDTIISDSFRIMKQRLETLNYVDRKRNELLDTLLLDNFDSVIFIKKWQSIQQYYPSNTTNLMLVKVELEQIRCFKNLVVSFQNVNKQKPKKWTMVLGDNATGKTTFLRSIAIGLCNESDGTALMRKMQGGFVRKGAQKGIIRLTLKEESNKKDFVITTTIEKMLDSESERLTKITNPEDDFPWKDIFVCGYGTHRTGMADASFDRYSPLYALSTLFDTTISLQNPEVVLLKAKDAYDFLSKSLLSILMLDDRVCKVTLPDKVQKSLEITGPWGKQPFYSLSDGYRSTLQWLLDFFGWAIYFGRLGSGLNIGGILLIDELEQHLHPRWQRFIVKRLAEKLPRTQVISTTHTPLVAAAVGDIPSSNILKLSLISEDQTVNGQLLKPKDFRGKRADQILVELFDLTTSRSVGSQNDISRYTELLPKYRNDQEERELQELSKNLQEKIVFGENKYEQEVEKAVREALEKRLKSPLDPKILNLEIKRKLREVFKE